MAFRTIPVPHSPGGLQLKYCNSCKHFRKLFCSELELDAKNIQIQIERAFYKAP
jgi:hypothetical protein